MVAGRRGSGRDERAARLKAALRANLRRRKMQARARACPHPAPGMTEDAPGGSSGGSSDARERDGIGTGAPKGMEGSSATDGPE